MTNRTETAKRNLIARQKAWEAIPNGQKGGYKKPGSQNANKH